MNKKEYQLTQQEEIYWDMVEGWNNKAKLDLSLDTIFDIVLDLKELPIDNPTEDDIEKVTKTLLKT